MKRFFNVAGVCEPRKHYMLPPLRRLPNVIPLIDEESYFVVHAPRQSGKSTCFHHLARELTAGGRYAAQLASCETARTETGQVFTDDALALAYGLTRGQPWLVKTSVTEAYLPIDERSYVLADGGLNGDGGRNHG